MLPDRDPEDRATDRIAMIILIVGIVLCLPAAGYLDYSRRKATSTLVVQEAEAGPILKPEEAVVDTGPDGGTPSRRMVLLAPEPWQKPPPCDKKQYSINGACYYRANPEDFKPPCEAPTVEWRGACYHAVARTQRPSTSQGQ